jgi:hypothetical protein
LYENQRVEFSVEQGLTVWLKDTFPDVHKQRGIWHPVTQLYWPLWENGLLKSEAGAWIGQLGNIIYHPEGDVQHSRTELRDLIAQLLKEDLSSAARYLAAAEPYAFTYREHPDDMFYDEQSLEPRAISSPSPLERQMREIDRRTDIGVRWSTAGV